MVECDLILKASLVATFIIHVDYPRPNLKVIIIQFFIRSLMRNPTEETRDWDLRCVFSQLNTAQDL